MYTDNARRSDAFSLVELSIVLVILGLLVGGILSGKSLIRASQLRSVITQHDSYHSAVRAFRDKYFALPGDMTNATKFWGVNVVGATCAFMPSTDQKTCDGDGNGRVDISANSFEFYRAWQHMANAGMIAGQYNGGSLPAGKTGAGSWWSIDYLGDITSGATAFAYGSRSYFNGSYGNAIAYSSSIPALVVGGAELTPEEVYNIDAKLDDGKPATGKILVTMDSGKPVTDCTDGTDASSLSSNYLLSGTVAQCGVVFKDGL